MSEGTDLSAVLPTPPYKATINGWPAKVTVKDDGSYTITATTPPYKATINGWPAKVTVKDDGSYTITATIPNYSIEWKTH